MSVAEIMTTLDVGGAEAGLEAGSGDAWLGGGGWQLRP